MRELQRFFQDYKALEHKKVLVSEPQGRSEALEVLRAAMRLYEREKVRLKGNPSKEEKRPTPPAKRTRSVRAAARRVSRR